MYSSADIDTILDVEVQRFHLLVLAPSIAAKPVSSSNRELLADQKIV